MELPRFNRQLWLWRKLFVLSAAQLVVTHIVLQLLDLTTTLFIIAHTSTAVEANPIMKFVLDTPGGMWSFAALKLTVCGILTWIIPRSLKDSPGCAWTWRALAIFYLVVIFNNLIGVAMIFIGQGS